MARNRKRTIPEILSPLEVEQIIKQPNKRTPTGLRNKAILSLIWDNGARVSDVINLKPGNISITKREAFIKNGKYGVDRELAFSEYTADLLRQHKEIRPKAEYFFTTLKGNKLDRIYLYNMIRRYAKRAGIDKKIGLHSIRHAFATNYYKNSEHDLIGLQKMLGHSDIRTTMIYSHYDNTDVKNGLNKYYHKRNGNDIQDKIIALEKQLQELKDNTKE